MADTLINALLYLHFKNKFIFNRNNIFQCNYKIALDKHAKTRLMQVWRNVVSTSVSQICLLRERVEISVDGRGEQRGNNPQQSKGSVT